MEHHLLRQNFIRYVTLNILGMIGLSCYTLADTFFVAQGLGADGLAALNLALPVYSLIHGAGLMIGMGCATRYTLSKSATVCTQAVYLLLVLCIPMVMAGVFASEGLARLLGGGDATLRMTSDYLQVILCFSPFFMMNNLVICMVRNDGNPKLSMAAMLLGSLSNIILDYVFVFPLGMGMRGAALATGIAPVVSLMVLSSHFIKKKNGFGLCAARPCPKAAADVSLLGMSAFIAELSTAIAMLVFNRLILGLRGDLGVAAYGVVTNLSLVVLAIFTGVAQGAQPLISASHAQKDERAARRVYTYGVGTVLLLAAGIYAVCFVFAPQIVSAFNRDGNPMLKAMAVRGLRLHFTAFFLAGVHLLTAAYFSAIGSARQAMLLSLLRAAFVLVPMAAAMAAWLGMDGVWLATLATEAVVFPLTVVLLRRERARGHMAC